VLCFQSAAAFAVANHSDEYADMQAQAVRQAQRDLLSVEAFNRCNYYAKDIQLNHPDKDSTYTIVDNLVTFTNDGLVTCGIKVSTPNYLGKVDEEDIKVEGNLKNLVYKVSKF